MELIQGVVNRLSHNSFLLKGWSVILISAMFALAAKDTQIMFVYLAYFPAIAFWILDGYFLWQERLFRALYNKVRVLDENDIDFSMDTEELKAKEKSWPEAMLSRTFRIFHGTIIGSIVVVMGITIILNKGGS